ncbi:MAG: glycosyltransferase family 4 protein [Gammaproteobacteria bacterium]|nr:glycosyltransferase family 4 protein [Gammaproteobacteria bacterium]
MRVTVVTTSFPLAPGSSSGAFVEQLMRALATEVAATVLTPCTTRRLQPQQGAGYGLRCFRYAPRRWQRLAHRPGGIPVALAESKLAYALLPPFLLGLLLACVRSARGSDLVHANWSVSGVLAGLAGRLTRTPVIVTLRGEDTARMSTSRLHHALVGWCLRLCDGTVAVSRAMRDRLTAQFPALEHRIHWIPNGVDEALLVLPPRAAAEDPPAEFEILTVGSLIPRKRVEDILSALAVLRGRVPARLTVVGDGAGRERLRRLTRELGVSDLVRFAGAVAPDEVGGYLAGADALVLASASEGRPNVVVEALAAAVPVVATRIDGVEEMIRDGETGLLFEVGDTRALAERLERLFEDPPLRRRLAEAGRGFVLEHELDWDGTAARYLRLYRRAVAARDRGARSP